MKKLLLSKLLLIGALSINNAQTIDLVPFAEGLTSPTDIKNAGDDRLFITEQPGTIRIISANGQVNSQPFLDIRNRVLDTASEQGLLGLAFDPNYASNGYFYINYTRRTNRGAESVVSRFTRANASTASPNSEVIMLTMPQPATNHNGGGMAFGPDGKLYVASGDGGGGNDRFNNGQNTGTPLGAILRFDVTKPDFKDPTNPFFGQAGNDYIYHYGLRNPWRFSFDAESGSLWIADVGDNRPLVNEEVNRVAITDKGLNFGWPCYEGNLRNPSDAKANQCSDRGALTFPVNTYERRNGNNRCSVTGGFVYRGKKYPNLVEKYIYTDYCSGEIFTLENDGSGFTSTSVFSGFVGLTTFGENNDKELFVAQQQGTIYQVVDNDQTLSVSDEFEKLDISISQNSNLKQISVNGLNETKLNDVSLISIAGQNALNLLENKTSKNTYSVKNISPGVYILLIETANNNKKAVKVLIQ